ncbi:MAG: hypothetical protein NVSMB14_12280 [Isosphaeraceae bacterium]
MTRRSNPVMIQCVHGILPVWYLKGALEWIAWERWSLALS